MRIPLTCARPIGQLVATVAALALTFASASAQVRRAASEAPASAEFLSFRQAAASGRATEWMGGHAFGYIPSPLDFERVGGSSRVVRPLVTLPSSYDARSASRLTAVRNQGSSGSCWAFASYGCLEAFLRPGETLDFSENNLKNTHGFDYGANDGGNRDMATAYLARWSGAIAEADDPYNATSTTSPSGLSPVKHVQEVLYLPARKSASDNDNIKSAVTQYGAVETYMNYVSTRYNATTKAYYYTVSGSNHAVDIVGWDDNYSASNFLATQPATNGAFLVRNSWGSSWGDGGYFWISYCDVSVGRSLTAFVSGEAADNYSTIYQYDPLGWVSSTGYGSNTAWYANVFTATSTQNLAAVSFFTPTANTAYTVSIYNSPTSGPLGTSGAALTQSGTMTWAGFHTVPLQSLVPIASGAKFSVVVKVVAPGSLYPIPVERPIAGYSSKASASAGQSYMSSDGATWTDVTTKVANGNACVKAYAKSGDATIGVSALTIDPASVSGGSAATGRVWLDGVATNSGFVVQLSSSSGSASVPQSVTIAAGASDATFDITTTTVSSDTAATITASANGVEKTAALTVTAPAPVPSSLALSPSSVDGGSTSTATVTLDRAAGTSGCAVQLLSDNNSSVPSSLTVSAGQTSATFTVTAADLASDGQSAISASAGGKSASTTLTIKARAVAIASISVSPNSVKGGSSATGTVTLAAAAPAGGARVSLSSSSASASVASSLTIAAGSTTGTFSISTSAVAQSRSVAIAGSYGGVSKSASFAIAPPAISAASLSPTSVTGPATPKLTVTLDSAAPSGGMTVALVSSASTIVSVPSTITVAAGSMTASATITVASVSSTTSVTLTATAGGKSASATLTVAGSKAKKVVLSPSSIKGGVVSTATVTLDAAAPKGGLLVTLTSSSASAVVPRYVRIAAGATTATFSVTTKPVASQVTATIKAAFTSGTASADLTIGSPDLSGLSLGASSLKSRSSTAGVVQIGSPAGPGGLVVSLGASQAGALSAPATVTIPAGKTSARFTVTAASVAAQTSVTLSASHKDITKSAGLVVRTN